MDRLRETIDVGGRKRLLNPLQDFLRTEIAGGVVLALAAVAALAWANIWPDAYEDFWQIKVSFVSVEGFEASATLRKLVVDGLMAFFFFVVGMEIKRELVVGELAVRRVAALGVFAAAGGMAVPALIFAALNAGDGEALRGWGIPMATDIAFALGALSLLRMRVPIQLAAFLLAVAVVDDIGAIAVIALFYTDEVSVAWLVAGLVGLGATYALVRAHVHSWVPYAVVGIFVWTAAYQSGVHATVAGVAMGLLMPVFAKREITSAGVEAVEIAGEIERSDGRRGVDIGRWQRLQTLGRESVPMLERFEHALHPWSSFVVLPIFALSSAGIVIRSDTIADAATSRISIGVALGLVLGNMIGIPMGAFVATRLGLAQLPTNVTWLHVLGAAAFAGIGFTVSIFIATLAYDDQTLVDQAKLGILVASLVAGSIGALILRSIEKTPRDAAG
jgi:NhaA family Na+:H+ antiporter